MASPPYSQSPTAMSPPFSHSQLPPINTMTSKKRTAEGGAAPPALKRRKPSTMSVGSAANSAHPLRQTSFPPDEVGTPFNFGGPRSPSVDMDAMSLVSGSQVSAAAPAKKKRGRKSKAEKAREQTPSVAGGRAATIISGISGGGKAAKSATGAAAAGGDDGEADDEGPTEVAVAADIVTKEQKDEEIRLKCMLVQALDPDQFHRYELWRAAGLNKINVRKVCYRTSQYAKLIRSTNQDHSSLTQPSRSRLPTTLSLPCAPSLRSLLATLSKWRVMFRANGLRKARGRQICQHLQTLQPHLPTGRLVQLLAPTRSRATVGVDRFVRTISAKLSGDTS